MTTIKLKNGSGAPTAGDLVQGEPALDLTNKRLYTEDSSGTVIEVGTNPTSITTGDITATGTVTFAGLGTTGDVTFGDNDKAIFGAGSDLQIYHNGAHSLISETGTGNLYVQGSSTVFLGSSTQNQVVINDGSDVKLRHNGSDKLATTSTGIDVTGTVTADDSMLVEGASGSTLTLKNTTTGAGQGVLIGTVDFFNSDTSGQGPSVQAQIKAVTANTIGNGADLQFFTTAASGGSEGDPPIKRMEIDQLGDISFYNDAGTSQDLYWDASTSRLGLGTTSPSYLVDAQSSGDAAIRIRSTGTGASDDSLLRMQIAGTTASNIIAFGDAGSSFSGEIRYTHNNNSMSFDTNGSERMRIDSSGNLLVSKTTSAIATEGVTLGGGQHYFTTDGDAAVKLNRLTSDGEIAQFRSRGTVVGDISVTASATAYNTSSDQRLKENIVDAPSASDDIDALQVRSFDWKINGEHQKYGMVAQELNTVAPEAVTIPDDPEEMAGVDYSKLVPMLVKEIQSLRARVARLEGAN